MKSVVYIIKIGKFAKIGFSTNLPERIKTFATSAPEPIVVMATFPGGRAEESRVHKALRENRLPRGEFFHIDAGLLSFITLVEAGRMDDAWTYLKEITPDRRQERRRQEHHRMVRKRRDAKEEQDRYYARAKREAGLVAGTSDCTTDVQRRGKALMEQCRSRSRTIGARGRLARPFNDMRCTSRAGTEPEQARNDPRLCTAPHPQIRSLSRPLDFIGGRWK